VQWRGSLSVAAVCDALELSRATWYRQNQPVTIVPPTTALAPRTTPETAPEAAPEAAFGDREPSPRALSLSVRAEVRDILSSERFCDMAPRQVFAVLLDEGRYLCSVSTMYRLLRGDNLLCQRRQRPPGNYAQPELLANSPNEVWSWDITKLRGPVKWSYHYLYVVMDIFSRYVVGWMVAERECQQLARQMISEACTRHGIDSGQLTLHADRGSSMTSRSLAELLCDLGVAKSHSRPHVSNDNPFSEAQFKTLKYHPAFPERFGCLQDARQYCASFFAWYNDEHRHSGLAWLTPEMVHFKRSAAVLTQRQATLDAAYASHPQRFNRPPQVAPLPSAVWINPPPKEMATTPVAPIVPVVAELIRDA
jgi:putative transposase